MIGAEVPISKPAPFTTRHFEGSRDTSEATEEVNLPGRNYRILRSSPKSPPSRCSVRLDGARHDEHGVEIAERSKDRALVPRSA